MICLCTKHVKVKWSADDTSIVKADTRNRLNRQIDLANNDDSFYYNKLTINTDKCEKMHFDAGLPSHLSLFDNQTKTKDSCKYLVF